MKKIILRASHFRDAQFDAERNYNVKGCGCPLERAAWDLFTEIQYVRAGVASIKINDVHYRLETPYTYSRFMRDKQKAKLRKFSNAVIREVEFYLS